MLFRRLFTVRYCNSYYIRPNYFLLIEIRVKPRSHLAEYFLPIVQDKTKFSERSENNRNDKNATCDYLSENLRMCFRLNKDSSRPFINIYGQFADEARQLKIDNHDKMRILNEKYANSSK